MLLILGSKSLQNVLLSVHDSKTYSAVCPLCPSLNLPCGVKVSPVLPERFLLRDTVQHQPGPFKAMGDIVLSYEV